MIFSYKFAFNIGDIDIGDIRVNNWKSEKTNKYM